MAYYKNKRDKLMIQHIKDVKEAKHVNIKLDAEEFISPRDALECLCNQKKVSFKEFGRVFQWFVKDNNLYAISRNIFVNINELRKFPNDQIIDYLKELSNVHYSQFNELGTNFHFFNKLEQQVNILDEKTKILEIDDFKNALYEVIFTKMDHMY